MKNKANKITVEELIRTISLENGEDIQSLISIFDSTTTVEFSEEKKDHTCLKLKDSFSIKITFGELVSKCISEKKLDLSEITRAVEIPDSTIHALANDAIVPFTVPVVLIKRLIEFLGMRFDDALKGLKLTGDILAGSILEDELLTSNIGISARRGHEISKSGIDSKTIRDRNSILQSNERYLQRLAQIANKC